MPHLEMLRKSFYVVVLSEILSMTYVMLKGYLYDLIVCIRPVMAIEKGKYT
jgi:hypothetical protein